MYISDLSEDDIEIAIKVRKLLDSQKCWIQKNVEPKKTSANLIQMFTQQLWVAGLGLGGPQKNPSELMKSALFPNFCPCFLRLRGGQPKRSA